MIGSSNALAQNKDWMFTALGNVSVYLHVTMYGYVEYVRTGQKRGFLTVRFFMNSNSYSSIFTVSSLSILGSLLGLSFKNPTQTIHVGLWDSNPYIDWQYGQYVEILTSGIIQLGRIYTTSGDFGDWQLSVLGNHNIQMWNIPVEEN